MYYHGSPLHRSFTTSVSCLTDGLGLSPLTGLPFSPPIAFRTASHEPKSRVEKTELLEGRCEKCDKWIPVETVKRDHNTKVRSATLRFLRQEPMMRRRVGQGALLVEARGDMPW